MKIKGPFNNRKGVSFELVAESVEEAAILTRLAMNGTSETRRVCSVFVMDSGVIASFQLKKQKDRISQLVPQTSY